MDYKTWLGITATAIGLVSYIPYFKNILANKTKPHAFSWLIWGILTAIGFAGQVVGLAGPGAWVTGVTAIICFIIFFFALIKGERNIVLLDWLSLGGAFIALLFWFITNGPLLSVILITLIDALGFLPTFRKAFIKPYEETGSTFFWGGVKFIIGLFALERVSIITAFYPLSIVVMNWVFVGMLVVRRRRLHN